MIFNEVYAQPNKRTFEIKPIKELIEKYIEGKDFTVDPFSNESELATETNDINPELDNPGNYMDALDFLKSINDCAAEVVLFDPPYSPRQLKECYNNLGISLTQKDTQSFWRKCKDEVARITEVNGICISFGWNTVGLGKSRDFEKIEVLSVVHGGMHNNTLVTVERKLIHRTKLL